MYTVMNPWIYGRRNQNEGYHFGRIRDESGTTGKSSGANALSQLKQSG
jgi:hypothetical protein